MAAPAFAGLSPEDGSQRVGIVRASTIEPNPLTGCAKQVGLWALLGHGWQFNLVMPRCECCGQEQLNFAGPRVLARFPVVIWREAITAARIDPGAGPRPPTPMEATRAGAIEQVAQRLAWVGAGNGGTTFTEGDPGSSFGRPSCRGYPAVGTALSPHPCVKSN